MDYRKISRLVTPALLGSGLFLSAAAAQDVSVSTSQQYVRVGTSFDISVLIDGLTAAGMPSLGAYDFLVYYDGALVALDAQSLQAVLSADPTNSIFAVNTATSGQVEVYEVSLETAASLDAAQGSSLSLGNLSFTALSTGTANFSTSGLAFSDAQGNALMPGFGTASIIIVDRTSIDEFAQPLSGSLMKSVQFAEKTQSCNHAYARQLSGNAGNTGCIYASAAFSDSEFDTIQTEEDARYYEFGGMVELENGLVFGAGYSAGEFDSDFAGGSAIDDGSRNTLSGFIGWNFDAFTVSAAYAKTDSDGDIMTVHGNLGGMVSTTPFDVSSEVWLGRASYDLVYDNFLITPAASLARVETDIDPLRESGADVLTVVGAGASDTATIGKAEVQISGTSTLMEDVTVLPRITLGWQFASSDTFTLNANFADNMGASAPDIVGEFDLLAKNAFVIAPGLDLNVSESVSVQLDFKYMKGSDLTHYVGSGGVRVRF